MGDQHPLDPFAQFEGIVDALRDAALRLPGVGNEELTNLSQSAGEAIGAIKNAFVTIPDGRTLLAVEHEALMTFARANGLCERTLWRGVITGRSGRVTVGEFFWRRVTDITALASCTKIKALYLSGNDIADISALARCRELLRLWLGTNRITDISSLASCGKLETLSLENNGVTNFSALAGCSMLTTLNLRANRLIEISGLASCRMLKQLFLGHNQITDISALECCTQLEWVSLLGNPLAEGTVEVIAKLRARGVQVEVLY